MSQSNGHIDLRELELWRSEATTLTRQELEARAQIAIHIEQCSECSEMAEAHALMFARSSSNRDTEPCPGEDFWGEFAAGSSSEPQIDALLAHASRCERCAGFMRLAVEASDTDPNVASLSSATPAWQAAMARTLAANQSGAPLAAAKSLRHSRLWRSADWLRSWPAYSFAALFLITLALGIWFRTRASVDTLIARAYDARRQTELRVPGGASVAMYSPVRGAPSSSDWPELLELKLAAEKGLQKSPDSPYWHQIAGRSLILQSDPAGALANFQVAYARNPALPGIQFDLGTAYFELGDQTHDTTNYGYAAEAFSRHLDEVHHQDSVALFDRALCWKRMGLRDQALHDFHLALDNENQPAWQQEIRSEMASLQQHAGQNHDPASGQTAYSLARSSPLVWNGSSESAGSYENSLNSLFDSGLDLRHPSNHFNLENLARDGEMHHDFWVSDWIRMARTSAMARADDLLASAARANQIGQSDRAIVFAADAEGLYSAGGNRAGLVRAGFEQVYALHRAGRAQDCLRAVSRAASLRSLTRYSFLRVMLLLEEASCQEMAGSVLPVKTALQCALADSSASALPGLYARAQGFLAAYFTQQGMPELGWNADVAGLQFCLSFDCSAMRQYQFVSDLTDDSISLGLNRTSIALAISGSSIAQSSGNLQIGAYAFEVLGQREFEGGLVEDAKRSFSVADAMLSNLGDTAATRQYHADWAADRAQLLAREGYDDLALSSLNRASPTVNSAQSIVIQFNYWSRRALLERSTDRDANALASARKAVEYANQVLAGLTDSKDRKAWQAHVALAYTALVDSLLRTHREQDALAAWETYRAAAELPVASSSSKTIIARYLLHRRDAPSASTLIFARLIDRYAVFVLDADGNMIRVFSPPATADAIDQLVRTFDMLCADPRSRLADVEVAGKTLYSILFSDVEPSAELRIEADGRLETLPFSALILPDGTYLGTRTAIVFSPRFWTPERQTQAAAFSASSRILVVRASAGGSEPIPETYDESREVANRFVSAELIDDLHTSPARILRALGSAQIFHFSGHAISQQGSIHLILGSPSSEALSAAMFKPSSLRTCKLAVLAACSTLGSESYSGSFISDLPEALLKAGVGSVLTSRWQIDSQSTRILMLAFYDELLKGNPANIALSNAETKLRTISAFQHPYFWSGFVIMQS